MTEQVQEQTALILDQLATAGQLAVAITQSMRQLHERLQEEPRVAKLQQALAGAREVADAAISASAMQRVLTATEQSSLLSGCRTS